MKPFFIAITVLVVFVFYVTPIGKIYMCHSKANMYGFPGKYSIMNGGCFIEYKKDHWIELDKYRVIN